MHWNNPSPLDQQQFDSGHVFAAGLALHHIANTAYPIAHSSTMRPYRVPRSLVQQSVPQAWGQIERLGLYVHIPFCQARCAYCEYTVMDPQTNASSEALYFDLLEREFELYRQALDTPAKSLVGFDIGGGTPSAVGVAHIRRVVELARRNFRLAERVAISIETTPRIAAQEPAKVRAYYEMGIRRISMGVQSVNIRLLQALGRDHTSLDFDQAATEAIRSAGFTSFNVDVMYGFARQPLESVAATLQHVIELAPEHITLYRMRYKGTRLAGQSEQVGLAEVVAQARLAKEMLLAAGYHGAPGKNTFSRLPGDPGTSDYLTERVIFGTPYLGLGLGAQSLSHHTLAYNSGAADKLLEHYYRQVQAGLLPVQDLYHLSLPAAMGKMIAVSFYFGAVHLQAFQHKFGLRLEEAFPAEIEFVLSQRLMKYTGRGPEPEALALTAEGEQQVNGVIALFYAGAVKEYLLRLAEQAGGEVQHFPVLQTAQLERTNP